MIWIIELCCIGVKPCDQKTRLELCCRHSGWGMVLHADAAQIGKCCDLLESGMSTSMYSSRYCLISSNTIVWNIYDGERSTWIKLLKLHTKSRQSFEQQMFRKVFFISIQSVKPRSEIWMAWVYWYKRRIYNRNHHQVLALRSLDMHMIKMIEHCWGEVKTCVQNTKPDLCCHHSAWHTALHADATQTGKCCDVPKHLITLHTTEEFKCGT